MFTIRLKQKTYGIYVKGTILAKEEVITKKSYNSHNYI